MMFHVSANTANRRRGKTSNNQLPAGLARYALNIIRERYIDFGPTLAREKLAELDDHQSTETVRSLRVKAGLRVPRKQRVCHSLSDSTFFTVYHFNQ